MKEGNPWQESRERKRTGTNRHWWRPKKDAVSMEIGRKRERKAGVGPLTCGAVTKYVCM